MTNEEIIALAREAGLTGELVSSEHAKCLQAFANAVIKQHEADLLNDVGEPAIKEAKFGGYDAYTAEQVAAAVAKKESVRLDLLNAALDRIATLESTLKLALEALETCTGESDYRDFDVIAVDHAREQIKEVLHAE